MIPDLSVRGESRAELNTKLSQIRETLQRGAASCVVVATSPTTASLPFTVQHTLNVVPMWAIGVDDTGMQSLGFTDSDYALWSKTSIVVRSATASTRYRILVMAQN